MKKLITKYQSWVCILILAAVFTACSLPSRKTGEPKAESGTESSSGTVSEEFDVFINQLFCTEVSSNTINLHFTLADPEAYGIADVPITLGDISGEAILESYAALENTASVLGSFDSSALGGGQQLTYEILEDYITTELSAADLTYYDEILRPSTGIQAQLPVLYEEYRFYNKEDIEDYLELIALTDSYFSQIIAFEQRKAAEGLFMSDYACENIISQCQTFAANKDGHYLIETFDNKLDRFEGISEEEREGYKARNEALVKENILPAYEKLAAALEELKGQGKNDGGLCHFPDGKEYYRYLVRHNTGCPLNIPEIQKLVEEQRLSDLKESSAILAENPGLWEECNAVKLEGMDPATALNQLREEMKKDFPEAPEADFTVSYIDECMEEYMAPAFYITAPIDDYGDNSIFINASTDSTTMRYFTTLAHEGFPGHLYQTVMSYEAGLPPVRSILDYPGYVEGWATYVEMISYQYAGLPEDVARLLALNQSALLSLYASTDFGIHYDGWSFEDTVSFWADYGITDTEALREVYELIVEEPSHYLKYYVGYVEFLRLKENARETYGSGFDEAGFHRAVLEIGPAPFAIVEEYLGGYYAADQ